MRSDASTDDLRSRREESLREKETARLRNSYGEKLALAIGSALGCQLHLADFDVRIDVPFKLDWGPRIEDAHGLVLPYVSEKRVVSVAECIDEAISSRGGWVGVHGNSYLGFCAVTDLRVVGLVAAASAIEDTVVFFPGDRQGAIAVDCYPSNPGEVFSLLVQGDSLVDELAPCFSGEDAGEGS